MVNIDVSELYSTCFAAGVLYRSLQLEKVPVKVAQRISATLLAELAAAGLATKIKNKIIKKKMKSLPEKSFANCVGEWS